jgi:hypothetical protein
MPRKKTVSPFENGAIASNAMTDTGDAAVSVAPQPVRKPLTEAAQAALAADLNGQAPSPEAPPAPKAHVQRNRKARTPFGMYRTKLNAEQRPGFKRRWFNDDQGRIQRAEEAGYVVVMDDVTKKPRTQVAGNHKNGEVMFAVLMEIPEEFWNEDFEAKQESLNEVDRSIMMGRNDEEKGANMYVPRSTPMNVRVEVGQGR